ncbi:MAG: hypothetical protein KDE27_32245 [Planctomycetes bacterium]|nr:hypothetical protein [Planctomycetota bacterium]
MESCPECGNHDLSVTVVDGAAIRECRLCGHRFGERAAVAALAERDDGLEHGFDGFVWPLVRVLRSLRGLTVAAASGGDPVSGELPAVRLAPAGVRALAELENLATSLRLGGGALHCEWVIEVQGERGLTFLLRPRASALARDAQLDLATLTRQIERDRRLSWWQRASGA